MGLFHYLTDVDAFQKAGNLNIGVNRLAELAVVPRGSVTLFLYRHQPSGLEGGNVSASFMPGRYVRNSAPSTRSLPFRGWHTRDLIHASVSTLVCVCD